MLDLENFLNTTIERLRPAILQCAPAGSKSAALMFADLDNDSKTNAQVVGIPFDKAEEFIARMFPAFENRDLVEAVPTLTNAMRAAIASAEGGDRVVLLYFLSSSEKSHMGVDTLRFDDSQNPPIGEDLKN